MIDESADDGIDDDPLASPQQRQHVDKITTTLTPQKAGKVVKVTHYDDGTMMMMMMMVVLMMLIHQ